VALGAAFGGLLPPLPGLSDGWWPVTWGSRPRLYALAPSGLDSKAASRSAAAFFLGIGRQAPKGREQAPFGEARAGATSLPDVQSNPLHRHHQVLLGEIDVYWFTVNMTAG
jgi:hypothetical protein